MLVLVLVLKDQNAVLVLVLVLDDAVLVPVLVLAPPDPLAGLKEPISKGR